MANKLVGLRLTQETIEQLEVIAHKNNQSVNSIAKNAILEWLEIFSRTRHQGMMILGKPLISSLLDLVDNNKLKEFAKLTADKKVDFFHFIIGKHPSENTLDDFIKFTPKILGDKGLMWFDHIEVPKENNSVYFKGVHSLGAKWSQFLIFFFNHIMEQYFNMKLNEENLKFSENSLYIEYKY